MKKSPYFSELIRSYIDEVDDLMTDSAGKPVLQQRLNEKRCAIDAILPMIEFSTEMVAVVFYDAFGFRSPEIMHGVVQSEPDDADFPAWDDLKNELTVAAWAEPLIESSLKVRGGDAFLVTTAALEYLRTRNGFDASRAEQLAGEEPDGEGEGDDYDVDDLSEAGADWLVEQGFETLER